MYLSVDSKRRASHNYIKWQFYFESIKYLEIFLNYNSVTKKDKSNKKNLFKLYLKNLSLGKGKSK